MSMINEKLLRDILTLPADIRSHLIEKLIESLNVPIDKEIDKLWAKEAEFRVKSIRNGTVPTLDGDTVIRDIRARLMK